MSFVRLENLNDFIQPSTACIKPVEKRKPGVVAKVADINLSDCLACSGCITSAESVLVQQQNHEELFNIINETKMSKLNREIVVSLSLQSIATLANKYSMDAQEAAERIASFLVSIGCDRVYDINLARHLALVESYREFKRRFKEKTKPPIISSICPGWICYAEKTNGDLVIPHLSRIRSPQQIMGALLKRGIHLSGLAEDTKMKPEIYHVTLMPCFDKKLEASRGDFKNELNGTPDVDCVLTPVELEQILESEGVSLIDFDRRKLDVSIMTDSEFDAPLTSHFGSVSGGYAENILLTMASEMIGKSCDELRDMIEYSTMKNGDFIELKPKFSNLPNSGDLKLPMFAIVNGFRNIQTIVQRLKRKVLKYDYIEIMACPSGCINGGAQCKPNDGQDQADTIKETKRLYGQVPLVKHNLDDHDKITKRLYEQLNLNDPQRAEQILYTDFHSVPTMKNLTVNW